MYQYIECIENLIRILSDWFIIEIKVFVDDESKNYCIIDGSSVVINDESENKF